MSFYEQLVAETADSRDAFLSIPLVRTTIRNGASRNLYLDFLGQLLHGNLGRSFQSNSTISSEIAARFPDTLRLTLAGGLQRALPSLRADAGAAAVHIEDQLLPKKCGHLNDKKLA